MAPGWDSFFHVLNPNAERRAAVAAFLEKRPWQRVWIDRTSHPTHLETVMAWAVNEGRRDVAVWGGDGSFSRAVNALRELGALDRVRLALVPAGTCNDFARKLGIPLWDALMSASGGLAERRIDLGLVEHPEGVRSFVNNAGFGRRPQARREKRPSPVLDILRLRAEPVEIETAGGGRSMRSHMRALMAIIFNAPYFGGGLHFAGDIEPDDGRIEGFFLGDQPRWRVLWSFVRGRSGRRFENPDMVSVAGTSIRVRTTGRLYPQADGESASDGGVSDITFSVVPGALTLLAPCLPGRQAK